MDGIEFVYLALGVGVGFASRFMKRDSSSSQPKTLPNITTDETQYQEKIQTLSKQLQQTQLAYQMASEMCQFKAGFLARTSHELRSPINSMIGTLQLILSDLCESPEEEREFLQQAYESALKMVGVLDEVIHVAKTEHGTESLKLQSLQLTKIFEALNQLTHLQAANRSIRLKIEMPSPDVYVMADASRLKQVLVNLVDTAISEMDQGRVQVSVHPEPKSGYVHIWIDDQRPVSAWSESWDLLQSILEHNHHFTPSQTHPISQDLVQLSPGMRLLMNQTLLELMKGHLQVLAVPTDAETSNFTRTQCSIPLAQS